MEEATENKVGAVAMAAREAVVSAAAKSEAVPDASKQRAKDAKRKGLKRL